LGRISYILGVCCNYICLWPNLPNHRTLIELRFQEGVPRLKCQRLQQERRTRATFLFCNIFPDKMAKCRSTNGHAMPTSSWLRRDRERERERKRRKDEELKVLGLAERAVKRIACTLTIMRFLAWLSGFLFPILGGDGGKPQRSSSVMCWPFLALAVAGIQDSCSGYACFRPWLLAAGRRARQTQKRA
jgi:hypothetical protein